MTKSLKKLISELEEIDSCEYAMFSLCLIKEIAGKINSDEE